MKLVYIEWIDASTSHGWQVPEKDETVLIRSSGWLVNKTPKTYTISSSQSKYGKFVDQLNIPKVGIKKFQVLKSYKD